MKLSAETQIEKNEAGYVWSMNTNLGDGKMMQVTGNFPRGASAKEMTSELDKIAKVMQIQRLKLLEIPASEGALRQQAEAGDKFQDDLDRMIEEHKGKDRMRADVKRIMDTLEENIRRTGENLESGKRHLASLLDSLEKLEAED